MKRLIKKVKSLKFNGIFSLSMGTLLSQGINVLIQPFLTRLLTPTELGQYSYILSIANLFIPIASLNLYLLIITARDESEAKRVTELGIVSTFLMMIIYILLVIVSQLFTNHNKTVFIFLLFINPLIIFTSGIYQILLSRDNRHKNYIRMSKAEISKTGSMGIMQVIMGLLNFGVFGQLMGKLISPIYYIKGNFKSVLKILEKISFKEYTKNIQKYLPHIIYSVPSQFISSFSYTIIMLSIISLYSAEEVGYYSVSVRVLALPIVLLSYNLSKVYLQELSESKNENKPLFKPFVNNVKRLTIISVIVFSAVAIIAPEITELIFGNGYKETGYYIAILCILFSVRFVTASLTRTFIIIEKQNIQMFLELLFILSGGLSYVLSRVLLLNIYSYLILISVLYAVVYAIILIYLGIQCRIWDKKFNV